ncbi:MAG TPA: SOS response-associated peptidase [Xanthobacteraceae bacterium]|jgi:putative SOS response-associated peptidase YedK|nr:SOS response-associated peptidase [Xanthobacteraceae bacterium]
MCGRFVIIATPAMMRAWFGYAEQPNFPARYNVAPTQPIPLVRLHNGKRSFALMRWGLLPSWVKDPKNFSLLINARGESALEKPAFKNAMRRRRCLIPNDGFYEWAPPSQTGAPRRPFFVRTKRDANGEAPPLAFAGLYEIWTGPNGEELDTVTIITTSANRTLTPLHHRMPVYVPPEAFDLWLDCANVEAEEAMAAVIKPAPENMLEAYEVSPAVNKVANDSAELIEPYTAPPIAPTAEAEVKKPRPKRVKGPDGQASLF